MSDDKPKNERGPLTLTIDADLGARVLRRCHDDGVDANEATTILWQRQLRREGSIVGEDDAASELEPPKGQQD